MKLEIAEVKTLKRNHEIDMMLLCFWLRKKSLRIVHCLSERSDSKLEDPNGRVSFKL